MEYKVELKELGIVNESMAQYASDRSSTWDAFASIRAVRDGLTTAFIKNVIVTYPLTTGDWADIAGIPRRSFLRYMKEGTVIKGMHAERILSTLEAIHRGLEVFGDEAKFFRWIKTSRSIFEGMSAQELLQYSYGKDIVFQALGRIEHGIYS